MLSLVEHELFYNLGARSSDLVSKRFSGRVEKRMYHLSPIQTEKSEPEGKRIMPQTRFIEFSAFPLTRGLGFLCLHRRPMFDFFTYNIKHD